MESQKEPFELKHCKIDGGLNLDVRNVTRKRASMLIPDDFPSPAINPELLITMERVQNLEDSDKFLGCRLESIEAILKEMCPMCLWNAAFPFVGRDLELTTLAR